METRWTTEDNVTLPFKMMEDTHLANVFYHINYYSNRYAISTLREVEKEIKRRKLTEEFLAGTPYPFLDPATKEWRKWSHELERSVVLK